ncbi:LOB domain-containing protein 33-like [Diospyros lotus]|uniref:LOB domain-containing protein 33-like n=1 Tax=Diospyros lotus TaxID=55363 RepID=UPI002250CF50|nr:LOB domain-containing protein 33-like [Diospyros lotus]
MTGLGSSCGACKFLRRRCTTNCVFAPYFCYDEASAHFAAVHKVFGASNASKLLSHLPLQSRTDAAITISFEALARMQDPIYGCVAHIIALQQQVAWLQEEMEILENQMASLSIDVSSCGSSQVTGNQMVSTNGLQFSSRLDENSLFSSLGNFSGSDGLNAQINVLASDVFGLEEQACFPVEGQFEAVEQGGFLGYPPWIENGSNIQLERVKTDGYIL